MKIVSVCDDFSSSTMVAFNLEAPIPEESLDRIRTRMSFSGITKCDSSGQVLYISPPPDPEIFAVLVEELAQTKRYWEKPKGVPKEGAGTGFARRYNLPLD